MFAGIRNRLGLGAGASTEQATANQGASKAAGSSAPKKVDAPSDSFGKSVVDGAKSAAVGVISNPYVVGGTVLAGALACFVGPSVGVAVAGAVIATGVAGLVGKGIIAGAKAIGAGIAKLRSSDTGAEAHEASEKPKRVSKERIEPSVSDDAFPRFLRNGSPDSGGRIEPKISRGNPEAEPKVRKPRAKSEPKAAPKPAAKEKAPVVAAETSDVAAPKPARKPRTAKAAADTGKIDPQALPGSVKSTGPRRVS